MACVRRLQGLSMKLGYHLCSVDRYCIANHCITSRNIYLSACCRKTPTGNPKFVENRYQKDLEDSGDLDFFGLNESSRTSSKKTSSKLSKEEKQYIIELVEKYSTPSNPKNVKIKSFGAIRYDRKIPEDEKMGDEKTGTTKRRRRKKRRTNIEIQQNNPEISQLSDPKISECNLSKTSDMDNSFLPESDEPSFPGQNMSFLDEQYFVYDGAYEKTLKQKNLWDKSPVSDGEPAEQSSMKGDGESCTANNEIFHNVNKTEGNEQDMSFVDEQYFSYDSTNKAETAEVLDSRRIDKSVSSAKPNADVRNRKNKGAAKVKEGSSELDESESLLEENEQNFSFIDKQYFSYNGQPNLNPLTKQQDHPANSKMQTDPPFFSEEHEKKFAVKKSTNSRVVKKGKGAEFQENNLPKKESVDIKSRKSKDILKGNLNQEKDTVGEIHLTEKEQTAYDASMKIRAKLEDKRAGNLVGKFNPKQFDSKGFRILTDQVPHFDNVPSIDVVKVLRKSIIYDQNDILAISKPYGLPSHDGPGVFHSVGNLLDQIVPKTRLFPVHRLDKDTTGVMMFAKSEEMANRLSECFLKRGVIKKYLVITKNVPELKTGEIDIPIAEGTVEGKGRMCLRPYYSPELSAVMKKRQGGETAITRYKTLDTRDQCAVLECIPTTGKKHQIRVHLAFGLNCPILGDHKYSHINKLAPMKLHPGILKSLKIQQSKVRHLAMHLHARSIAIPEFLNGRNLFILAPLPPHFVRNLKDLKLKLPPYC